MRRARSATSTATASRIARPRTGLPSPASAPPSGTTLRDRSEPALRCAGRGYDAGVGASPARLRIALSVAAALAIFVVYTALAGAGVAQLTPSTVTSAKGTVLLVGKVVGPVQQLSHDRRRFQVKDIGDRKPGRVLVNYSGSVPDLFGTGKDISVSGRMRGGSFAA